MAHSDDGVPPGPKAPAPGWHEFIARPNDLARKVPRTGGKDPARAIDDAERALRTLQAEYEEKLGEDIARLEGLGRDFRERGGQESLDALFALIHNMRGQGATFGYPLITEIGRSFCRYVRALPAGAEADAALVSQHVDAMRVVYREHMRGAGPEVAQAVVSALSEAVARRLGETP